MNVILDTGTIIQQFMAYDPYFSFYEDGIKTVVKNAVLTAGRRRPRVDDHEADVHWLRSLAGRTISDWQQAVDISLEFDATEVHEYQQTQEKVDGDTIQFVVEQIQSQVENMIFGLMNNWRYHVSPLVCAPWEQTPREWIGDDLIVRLEPNITSETEE